jgi:hypothetical protein
VIAATGAANNVILKNARFLISTHLHELIAGKVAESRKRNVLVEHAKTLMDTASWPCIFSKPLQNGVVAA